MQPPITTSQFITHLSTNTISHDDLLHLLHSKHENLVQIFQAILVNSHYKTVAKKIVLDLLGNMYKMLSEKLEVFIIENVWKNCFLGLFEDNSSLKLQGSIQRKKVASDDVYMLIFMFLCQKMRSLIFTVRLSALKSFQNLLKTVITTINAHNANQPSDKSDTTFQQAINFQYVLTKYLKTMLRKQQLLKVVSYNQGLFLQLLQDEFHETRVTTLAVLQLVILESSYFWTSDKVKSQAQQAQTLNALKQTILYMLNDEHQLVRERSLVTIYRTCGYSKSNQNCSLQQNIRKRVFYPLSREEIFTILMCLRENNSILRQKVYEVLKSIKLINVDQLLLILQRLYHTLLTYKQDKHKIYLLLKSFSITQKNLIMSYLQSNPKVNMKSFYEFNNEEEPNCKNMVYKGKVILLRQVIQEIKGKERSERSTDNKWRSVLPGYVLRHLNYVEDTEARVRFARDENEQNREKSGADSIINDRNNSVDQEAIVAENNGLILLAQECIQRQTQESDPTQTLNKILSILNYQFSLTQQKSFEHQLLKILIDSTRLFLKKSSHVEIFLKEQQKNQKMQEQQPSFHDPGSFLDLGDGQEYESSNQISHQLNYNQNHSQTQYPKQEDINMLIYGRKEIDEKLLQTRQLQTQTQEQQLSPQQVIFDIASLKYIFDFTHSATTQTYHQVSLINQILSSVEFMLTKKQYSHIDYVSNLILKYLQSQNTFSLTNLVKQRNFKLRPLSVGRNVLGTGYKDSLLIMVGQPYQCHFEHGKDIVFQDQYLWLKLNTVINSYSTENGTFTMVNSTRLQFFVKFQDIFQLTEIRPLIDYNQNRTIFSAQLPLKITSSKYNVLANLLSKKAQQQSNFRQTRHKVKKAQQVNFEKYLFYQQRQIIINAVQILFVVNYDKGNQDSKKQKVLVEWIRG